MQAKHGQGHQCTLYHLRELFIITIMVISNTIDQKTRIVTFIVRKYNFLRRLNMRLTVFRSDIASRHRCGSPILDYKSTPTRAQHVRLIGWLMKSKRRCSSGDVLNSGQTSWRIVVGPGGECSRGRPTGRFGSSGGAVPAARARFWDISPVSVFVFRSRHLLQSDDWQIVLTTELRESLQQVNPKKHTVELNTLRQEGRKKLRGCARLPARQFKLRRYLPVSDTAISIKPEYQMKAEVVRAICKDWPDTK
ncbi:hypothetical protein B0H16DRAFT_1477192 [Mycena metata]|uniref:Uncharacterized protein n=1 Tax=Mycena metata TaxID=1033252 RepID=A0AAD7MFR8_9AGAR|nr:hypothetical protein B0H16DRAFT_1477192 [Mycena metata]